jgi:hypothetical protein
VLAWCWPVPQFGVCLAVHLRQCSLLAGGGGSAAVGHRELPGHTLAGDLVMPSHRCSANTVLQSLIGRNRSMAIFIVVPSHCCQYGLWCFVGQLWLSKAAVRHCSRPSAELMTHTCCCCFCCCGCGGASWSAGTTTGCRQCTSLLLMPGQWSAADTLVSAKVGEDGPMAA